MVDQYLANSDVRQKGREPLACRIASYGYRLQNIVVGEDNGGASCDDLSIKAWGKLVKFIRVMRRLLSRLFMYLSLPHSIRMFPTQ